MKFSLSKLLISAVLCVGLAACGTSAITNTISKASSVNDSVITNIAAISNALQPDILNAQKTASTINPLTGKAYDQPVADCITNGIIPVKSSVDTLLAAAKGSGNGVVTDAVVAGIIAPGSDAYVAAENTLGRGCAAALVEHGVSTVSALGNVAGLATGAAAVAP